MSALVKTITSACGAASYARSSTSRSAGNRRSALRAFGGALTLWPRTSRAFLAESASLFVEEGEAEQRRTRAGVQQTHRHIMRICAEE